MRKSAIVLMAFILAVGAPVSYGATDIVLDHVSTIYMGDEILAGCTGDFVFRLRYTPGDNSDLVAISNGFRVWTIFQGNYTNQFSPITADTLPVGLGNYLDGGVFVNYYGVDGIGVDTVGIGGFSLFASGIPDGFNEQVWQIHTRPYRDGDTLCIDSSFYPPHNPWLWSTNGSLGEFSPGWYGPYCFRVTLLPCIPPTFIDCPSELFFSIDTTAAWTFCTIYSDCAISGQISFKILSGPGELVQANDSCVQWSYTPTSEDCGKTYELVLESYAEGSCEQCAVNLSFAEDTILKFVDGCNDFRLYVPGDTVTQQMTVLSCATVSYYVGSVTPPPAGSYSIDENGVLRFNSASADSGLFTFEICANNGYEEQCCNVYFSGGHCCSLSGDIDYQGDINVGDITYLVSFLFKGGPPSPCGGNADVDGSGDVNVADLTYLVNYLFKGGAPPAPCP